MITTAMIVLQIITVNEYFMDSFVSRACFSRAYPIRDFHANPDTISNHKAESIPTRATPIPRAQRVIYGATFL